MWNKPGEKELKSPVAATPPPRRIEEVPLPSPVPEGNRSVIGKSMRIKGEISSQEELRIDGEVEGTIEVANRLIIGPSGKTTAALKAKEVDIHGSLRGNVEAADKVTVRKTSNIVGDVRTSAIEIEDGAYFKGGIDIARPDSKPAATVPGGNLPVAQRVPGSSL